jgi:hypothetical protein
MKEAIMRKTARLLTILLLGAASAAPAFEIAGTEIPDSLDLAGAHPKLLLNGAGVREKFFLDVYIGALYLPARTSDAGAILGDHGPASVLMHFLYHEVSREKITDGWRDGLRANLTPDEMRGIQADLEKFNSLFLTARKGDVIRIDHRPGSGTDVRINGQWRGMVAGDSFFRSLLKIWLGPEPVSQSLKEAMLGN